MLTLDPEVNHALTHLAEQQSVPSTPTIRGDWQSLRQSMEQIFDQIGFPETITEDIEFDEFQINTHTGDQISLRLYTVKGAKPTAAIVYVHGGGKIGLGLGNYDPICRYYAAKSGVAVLSVGFRLAPEFPYPTSVEDCYAGLQWLSDNAQRLGINTARIGIAGDSGGGGIAAGVALMARDKQGPALAKQFLIYPMLDDRNVNPDPQLEPFAVWSYDDNWTGWHCYLGDSMGSDTVSPYAAPLRSTNLSGLPPAYIDVGELDIFRDESIQYASQLYRAGVSAELHVYPRVPHAFEILAPQSQAAAIAWKNRIQAVRSLFDEV